MGIQRRTLCGFALWASLTGALGQAQADESARVAARPNVLLIVVDDMATRLGCYGDARAKSPHIDRLAERGLRFTRAYSQATTCNPSRTSFLSGLRPHASGIFENNNWRELELLTLPEYFADQGYRTVKVGKIFHPTGRGRSSGKRKPDTPRRKLWSRSLSPERGQASPDAPSESDASEGFFYSDSGTVAWAPQGGDPLSGPDANVARAAAAFLAEEQAQPFLLAVGFAKPHLPFYAPAPYFDLYDPAELRPPRLPAGIPVRQVTADGERGVVPSLDLQRRALQAYYACTSYVDACVGLVLDALETSGRRKDTVVILLSDHGQMLGEHGLWHKGELLEEGLRVPLIVAGPGTVAPGVCERPVELVDLFPSLIELCGTAPREGLEGKSFAPLLADPTRPWKRAAFSYERDGTTLRTEHWRLVSTRTHGLELYDHRSDPGEHFNLADRQEHAETRTRLEQLLAAGWVAAQ